MSSIEFKRVDRGIVVSKSNGLYLTAGSQVVHLSVPEGQFDKLQVRKGDLKSIEVPADGQNFKIDVVYGVYRLVSGLYLAVVTHSKTVARAPKGQDILLIEKVELYPVGGPAQPNALSTKQLKEERTFLEFIVESLLSHGLHYSETYDLTHTAQRLSAFDEKTFSEPLWKRADPRFFWNRALLNEFITAELHDWIVPVTSMFVKSHEMTLGDVSARLLFLSRRGHLRQGTRYFVRGIDETGNVANFVETEEISMRKDGSLLSYVQIRGSVPTLWEQLPTLKYAAKIEFTGTAQQNIDAAERHFAQVNAVYGDVVCVNLINKTGGELKLGMTFQETVAKISMSKRVRYVWFDFHHECRKMKWENLSKLVTIVAEDFDRHGYFSVDAAGKVLTRQSGVMRTNCVDNLDRTNVVQSLFGRRSILAQFGKESDSVLTSPFDEFEVMFKNLWADNADAVSVLYSGTGALKTDFTRTGKRTKKGALADGWNSAHRYYLNNFCDGKRQDSLDVFLGKYAPEAAAGGARSGSFYQKELPAFGPNAKNQFVRLFCIIVIIFLMAVTGFQCTIKKLTNRPKLRPSEYIKPAVELDAVLSTDGLRAVSDATKKKH